jgi:hypothetical protein
MATLGSRREQIQLLVLGALMYQDWHPARAFDPEADAYATRFQDPRSPVFALLRYPDGEVRLQSTFDQGKTWENVTEDRRKLGWLWDGLRESGRLPPQKREERAR